MKRFAPLGLVSAWSLVIVLACRTVPLVATVGGHLRTDGSTSQADAAEAIWRAGRKVGWNVEQVSPGDLRATLQVRQHVAVVRITHDERTFTIQHESTTNLLESGGEVHKAYNVWVGQLAEQIEKEPVNCCASFKP